MRWGRFAWARLGTCDDARCGEVCTMRLEHVRNALEVARGGWAGLKKGQGRWAEPGEKNGPSSLGFEEKSEI